MQMAIDAETYSGNCWEHHKATPDACVGTHLCTRATDARESKKRLVELNSEVVARLYAVHHSIFREVSVVDSHYGPTSLV